MQLDISKVGITGASGNIGSTLTERLSDKYELSLFDRQASGPVKQVDFAEPSAVKGAFDGLDAVIHLAGNPSPAAPHSDTFRNNFVGTSNVFQEAYRAGVKKIVFASSNFYHEGDIGLRLQDASITSKIQLNDEPTPQSMYGKSKVFGENVGLHLSNLGLHFAALRIGWTVPSDNPRPYAGRYMAAMFCSKRDLAAAFDSALRADQMFLSAFVISNNDKQMFDMEESVKILNWKPQDNYETFFS